MRATRRIAAVGTTALLLVATQHMAIAEVGPTAGAEVTVEGVVERLSDTSAAEGTALRLPDGERLPIDDPGEARTGDRVEVTIPVPDDVAERAAAEEQVDGTDGPVRLHRSELRAATHTPAPSDSALSDAVVADSLAASTPVQVEDVTVTSHEQRAAGAPTAGVHQVTVAIVVPRGVRGTVPTAAQVAHQVANVGAYWREQSGGVVDLRLAKTSRAYTSSFTCDDSPFRMWTEAARATGFTEGARRHLVMVFPREAADAGCSYGLASMGQSPASGGVSYVSDTAWPVLAHEIGHNFGLAHAQALRCGSASDANLGAPPRGCAVADYADPYDVMAASARDRAGALSTPQAARVGFLRPADVVDVTSPTARVTLAPVSSMRGVRAARIRDPRSGEVYWVEYRTRTGRDARLYQPMTAGVRVLREERVSQDHPWPGTIALDATPTGRRDDHSWHLPSSHRLSSYTGAVHVAVERVTNDAATVFVNVTSSSARVAGAVNGQVTRFGRAAAAPTTAMRSVSVGTNGVVSWSGSAAGTVRYDAVVRRMNGRSPGPQQTWYANTTRTSARLSAPRGTTLQVRVRARGGDGSVSGWSEWRTVTFR